VVKLFGRSRVFCSPGCARYGFRLEDRSMRPTARAAATRPST
jgi:hypothetical protein